jgi:DNA repair protein RecN (Recombination protein N)
MLNRLAIRNFAIIDQLEIPFRDGYTVFTGETGAGKSIIVDALDLILGGRASTDLIRTGEEEAHVEGHFELTGELRERIDHLLEREGHASGETLRIRRRIRRDRRNRVYVNGESSTVGFLRELTPGLVDISGQHEHYSLLESERHLEIVDAVGELDSEREAMADAYERVQSIRNRIASLKSDLDDHEHRADVLEYQLEELEEADLTPGEEETLENDLARLKHGEAIGTSVQEALELCYEGNRPAVEQLSLAIEHLSEAAQHDGDLEEYVERLERARIESEEISRSLTTYLQELEVDPERIDAVVERLEELKQLERKHDADDVEGLIERTEQLREEVDFLRNAESNLEELREELQEAERAAFQVARDLSRARRRVAATLQERIERELSDLNMGATRFSVRFVPPELPPSDALDRLGPTSELQLGPRGFDTIEFVIAPNPGEALQPMAEIASGGELSRIMLAIKSVLMERDDVETYVFDEVDTGIGGRTADVVGRKIQKTADSHQIICITHLPQIASRADHHYRVEKTSREGRTHSHVDALDDDERIEEIARMLGGTTISDKTREAARELLVVGHES